MVDVDPRAYEGWSASSQEKALELLKERAQNDYHPFFCPQPGCDGKAHGEWVWPHARANQHPPPFSLAWYVWLLRGGRGSGKTRVGAETTHKLTKYVGRMALVAQTGTAGREVMIEGESGLLATAAPGAYPNYEPSKRKLTWPNGAQATLFSAEEPDRLRGPQHGAAWLDEPAHMALIAECWSNLRLGLRLKSKIGPRIICTTTPLPTEWLKELVDKPNTIQTVFSTYENLANLDPTFTDTVLSTFEGTRQGRQELYGEILMDVPGALWTWSMIDPFRQDVEIAELDRIVVAIDPAGTDAKRSDLTGIIVLGRVGREYFVLADLSGRYTPNQWATVACRAAHDYQADCIVAERNYGGQMVKSTIRQVEESMRVITVDSRRGKETRVEAKIGLYEQGRVHHPTKTKVDAKGRIVPVLIELETQQTEWQPKVKNSKSPDRVDALIHGLTELSKGGGVSDLASPSVLNRLRQLTTVSGYRP